MIFFRNISLIGGGGSGIPKLYVKFWWPLFLALKPRFFWPKNSLGITPKKISYCFPKHKKARLVLSECSYIQKPNVSACVHRLRLIQAMNSGD